LRAAEAKQFDAILVDDSSRLSRDNQHFTAARAPLPEAAPDRRRA